MQTRINNKETSTSVGYKKMYYTNSSISLSRLC